MIPPLSEWSGVHFTMTAYIVQGFVISAMNIPLIFVLLFKKQNRMRKEFVIIAIVSLMDLWYVMVNVWNSWMRLTSSATMITRFACNNDPMLFSSLVVSQLVAGMPLIVALDRLLASFFGAWYYKLSYKYPFIICTPPVIFAIIVAFLNYWFLSHFKSGHELVTSLCFTSVLPAPEFKMVFHSIKWFFIFLAGIIYGIVALILRNTSAKYPLRVTEKRIKTANQVMGLSTMNSVIFHLIPDIFLVIPTPLFTVTITIQCILFSLILDKVLFNFILYMIFHKELRVIYKDIFKKKPRNKGNSSGGASVGGQPKMFTPRN